MMPPSRRATFVGQASTSIDELQKPIVSSLRARFNPRLVGFGIAKASADLSTGASRGRLSENQK